MKLPILSSSEVESILRRAGFEPAPKRGKGSHKAFVKQEKDKKYLVIVLKRGISPGERFLPLLNKLALLKKNLCAY
ncbi:hypothetical protein TH606_05260 [Thermodesulfatator autotrophicus]|uniref:Addiction module toxin, HicA family n=1 Tax=Thermodesulfatator autotrophicus TaxID=1795632 RepID=A0A177E746_9BACT|nr:hypothetical protein TH606_05260 [Thermodesulfatator autotrophicus]